jgi:hypothetical protein
MPGAFLIGYLIGHGLWLVAAILYILLQAYISSIEALGAFFWSYRQAHPTTPARQRRNAILLYSTIALTSLSCLIFAHK